VPDATAAELIARLNVVHVELAAKLQSYLDAGLGERWTPRFVSRQMDRVDRAIREAGGKVVGPPGRNGLAAEFAHTAYSSGIKLTDELTKLQGVVRLPEADFEGIHDDAARRIADELVRGRVDEHGKRVGGLLRNLTDCRANQAERYGDVYRRVQARATIEGIGAGESSGDVLTRMLKMYADQGVQGFVDKAGRNWDLAWYADMCSRTVGARALEAAELARCGEIGVDTVQVIGGEILRTCETCRVLQGRILSISGKAYPAIPGFWGSLDQARAMNPPLGHPCCAHHLSPYIPSARLDRADLNRRAKAAARRLGLYVDEWPDEIDVGGTAG